MTNELTEAQILLSVNQNSGFVTLPYLEYAFNASIKNNFLYIENQKTGCSSLKQALVAAELGNNNNNNAFDFKLIHNRKYSPLLNVYQVGNLNTFLKRKDIHRFSFVRNPYTRLLSAYLDKIKTNQLIVNTLLKQTGQTKVKRKDITFEAFVGMVGLQTSYMMDPHWRIQYYNILYKEIDYGKIYRFENLESEVSSLLKILNINQNLYSNVSPHKTKANDLLDKYYTTNLKDRVYDIFEIDFDTFGYNKELPG